MRALRFCLPWLIAAPLLAQDGGWWSDLDQPETATLEEVLAKPTEWLGRRVRVAVQVQKVLPIINPLYTAYEDSRWMRFGAWADGAQVWQKEVFSRPHAHFYAKRGSVAQRSLRRALPYVRFALDASVVQVIAGEPWLEVRGARRLSNALDEAAVLRVVRAEELFALGRLRSAAKELGLADGRRLPKWARLEFLRREASWHERLGDPNTALQRLRRALALDRKNAPLLQDVARLEGALGKVRPVVPGGVAPAGGR